MSDLTEEPSNASGEPVRAKLPSLAIFALILGLLALVRLGLAYASFPDAALPVLNFVSEALFLGGPIVAIYYASQRDWRVLHALGFLLLGLALQFGWGFLPMHGPVLPIVRNLIAAISQAGVPIWTLGLGALIASIIRDKNMLLPIGIVLFFLDVILVLTPVGAVKTMLDQSPNRLASVAISVPKPKSVQESIAPKTAARIVPLAYVGPADAMIVAMFFVSLHKFSMRAKETFRWIVPTLLAYLLFVTFTGISLPALVPITAVTAIANWREFHLKKDEVAATLVIAAFMVALTVLAATRKAKPAAPSPKAPAPAPAKPANSLPKVS